MMYLIYALAALLVLDALRMRAGSPRSPCYPRATPRATSA